MAVSEMNRFVIVIENKVWSTESNHQLRKYRKSIQEEFPHYRPLFIFLTPDGASPSDEENWLSFDYDHLIDIIEKGMIVNEENLSQRIKLFLEQYITTVRRYIVDDRGNGWTSSKRILLFEFQNKNNKLTLYLKIGPGDPALRQNL
ncbi:PD-(D/E)XK nuclease family protein [Natribacillus halophilus]|uniref:PD-(D/E)XK nuclease family protein n=1 Tax=Natribacillus halophilus TaxID=549003 RepID=UPI001FDECA7B